VLVLRLAVVEEVAGRLRHVDVDPAASLRVADVLLVAGGECGTADRHRGDQRDAAGGEGE
jgi:hypothetical protein